MRILLCIFLLLTHATHAGELSGEPYSTIDINKQLDLNLPELGDTSQTVFSLQDERRIGQQILRQVATSDEVLHDVEVQDYLQHLGNTLVEAGPDKQLDFTFFIVKDKSINAFAMPGGVIGVHTGLMLAANTESELASVLGHEIGHVTQHHLARMLESQKNATLSNVAGIALALLAARANPQLATGAMTAAQAYGVQKQLDYSREHEREADRVGLTILHNAGFDARGMPAFFKTLQFHSRHAQGTAPSFLRTHPLTTERIADVSNRVETLPYRQVKDSLSFALMRAKIQSFTGLAQNWVDHFSHAIASKRYQTEAAAHYGLAYALLRKNDATAAMQQVNWLKKNAAAHPAFAVLEAAILQAQLAPKKAIAAYNNGLQAYPDYRGLLYGKANLLLAIKQTSQVVQFIKANQHRYPDDARFYELLAKAYTAQGKVLLRHQAQAEAYYRQYDINRAVEQMDLAAKAKDGDFYQKSIVEARLKVLRRLQKIEREAKENA